MAGYRGDFLWYEIMTTDTQAASAFYTQVVGWTAQATDMSGMAYTVLNAGENGIGGVMELPQPAREMGAPPHWLAYVGVPDTDETVALVRELGGRVYAEPMDIPNVGRVAIVTDPQGAVFGVYTPDGDPSEAMSDHRSPRHFCWHELWTNEPTKALAFYSRVFGWNETGSMDFGGSTYQMYGRGEQSLGGIALRPEAMPVNAWIYYVDVPDFDAAVSRVTEKGGTVMQGPMEIPGGFRIAVCQDPQGAAFALHGK